MIFNRLYISVKISPLQCLAVSKSRLRYYLQVVRKTNLHKTGTTQNISSPKDSKSLGRDTDEREEQFSKTFLSNEVFPFMVKEVKSSQFSKAFSPTFFNELGKTILSISHHKMHYYLYYQEY